MTSRPSVYLTKNDRKLLQWLVRYGVVDYALFRRKLFKDKVRIAPNRLTRYRRIGLIEERLPQSGGYLLRISPTKMILVADLLDISVSDVKCTNLHRPALTTMHSVFCSSVGIELEAHLRQGQIITESKMLRYGYELDLKSELNGTTRRHRPDFLVSDPDSLGGYVALEVELTAKSMRRLRSLFQAYLASKDVKSVLYFCGSDYLVQHLVEICRQVSLRFPQGETSLTENKIFLCNIHEFLKQPLEVTFQSLSGTYGLKELLPILNVGAGLWEFGGVSKKNENVFSL